MRHGHVRAATILTFLACSSYYTASAQRDYRLFESDPVRPLAMNETGTRLYVTNTPDGRVEVFDLTQTPPEWIESVPVGMEPVAIAMQPGAERLWVVNHLSDSVSIVDTSSTPAHVVETLFVGDEPRDIVFAGGSSRTRAFITTAHRGQHSPYPLGEYTRPGIGRADVYVFDVNDLDDGTWEDIVVLFGDRPRALTVSDDGETVFAAVFRSGNHTTVIPEGAMCNGPPDRPCRVEGTPVAGGNLLPRENRSGVRAPRVSLIVRYDLTEQRWTDELGRNWNDFVPFELPDEDVFAIDATSDDLEGTAVASGVGTILFNMVVNPANDHIYVSNTEARNEVRFEGYGEYAAQFKPEGVPASVRGHLHEARVTVIDPDAPMAQRVVPRHLNPHIDYSVSPVPAGVRERSLAQPMGMAVSRNGATLYLAAFSSQEVAFIDTAALEAGTYAPAANGEGDRVRLTGGGPTGVLLDEGRGRLYVATRFNNAVSVVDVATRSEISVRELHNPEPEHVRNGRRFLYDARLSSSNGESSCGSCHVFGDMDDLGWDLGDPDGEAFANGNPAGFAAPPELPDFHPMKGPMTTQSLRGMANQGPLHWRGDRTGATRCGDALDEIAGFLEFNGAFEGLLGRDEGALAPQEMRAFADFALALMYPPNPSRQLDNQLRPGAEQLGETVFFDRQIDAQTETCESCHTVDRETGAFGSNGLTTFEGEEQLFKVAHLRNVYQKIGMFGVRDVPILTSIEETPFGRQVRGFGLIHDGTVDTVDNFLRAFVFVFNDEDDITNESPERRAVGEFMIVAPTDFAPIVGQQVTLTASEPTPERRNQLTVLRARATAQQVRVGGGMEYECDLIANAVVRNGEVEEARGYVWNVAGSFWQSDRLGQTLTHDQLVGLLAGEAPASEAITFTCVAPGTGYRAGVDRDSDFALDRDELDAQTNPRSAASVPSTGLMPGSLPPIDLGVFEPTVCVTPDAGPRVDSGMDAGVDAGTMTASSGGCGCRVAQQPSVSWPAPLLGLGLLAVGRLRRRQARGRRHG